MTVKLGKQLRGSTKTDQRSNAVRITNDCVARVAVADPVKRSHTSPICGSSEKLIAIADCGLTKCARIKVMSVSPRTVTDIDMLALGARIIMRIQASLLLEAAIRVDVATTLSGPCGPLATTWSTVATAAGFREPDAGRTLRGIGTGSVDLAGRAVAVRPAEVDFWPAIAVAAPSSSSSFDLTPNNAANRLGLLLIEASSPLPRFSMSARASSYPLSGLPSAGTFTVVPSGDTRGS